MQHLEDVAAPAIPAELLERRLALVEHRVAANRLAPEDARRLREEATWRRDDFGAALDKADKLTEDMLLYFDATPGDEETASLMDHVRVRLAREGRLELSTAVRRSAPLAAAPRQRARPRGRASRRTARTSRSSDDGPEPPPRPLTGRERSYLKLKIDELVRARLATLKECTSCGRDLPRGAFRPARSTCTDCEITARTERRHAKAVAA